MKISLPDLLRGKSTVRRRGFTIPELIIAGAVGMMITGTMMLLLIESAKEQYRGVADATVEEAANDLQSQMIKYLRSMSANEGMVFAQPVTNVGAVFKGYQRVIVAHGPAPDYPREEIRFDPQANSVTYNPNLSTTNNLQVVLQSRPAAFMLRNLCFLPAWREDGMPDNSLVFVVIELDDNGSSRRTAHANPAHVQRTFAVKMRNN